MKSCHERVNHCGVKDTLLELRTQFWVVVVDNLSSPPCQGALSVSILRESHIMSLSLQTCLLFEYKKGQLSVQLVLIIVDRCLLSQERGGGGRSKVWISVFSCNSSRAIHLELVIDLTVDGFLRCFHCFSARRGLPRLVTSDNASTFKAASKILLKLIKSSKMQAYFASKNITWKFLLEKAPWQGGCFERLIRIVKRTLKKILGNAFLSYEELQTVVTDVECTVNSRPITYLYSNEQIKPLTPSHLVAGRRLLSLPQLIEDE